jgi:hypothetical protein
MNLVYTKPSTALESNNPKRVQQRKNNQEIIRAFSNITDDLLIKRKIAKINIP